MSSFQITITPSERAAGRFVSRVRRAIQKALAEETQKNGITQSDIARAIGVNRSVISREIRGHKDITLSRVGELAWALGRVPMLELMERSVDNFGQGAIASPPKAAIPASGEPNQNLIDSWQQQQQSPTPIPVAV
jgi:transcriptional regulator with XRE-family HTH domain